jgi:hypothetical protein
MDHPVLRVRKGAQVYDDRAASGFDAEARKAMLEAKRALASGRGRRKKRRGRLAFLPLLILALGLVAVIRLAPRGPQSRATISGWQATLRASRAGDELVVGVTFELRPSSAPAAAADASVRVDFGGTADSAVISAPLERSPMTLYARAPAPPAGTRVSAEVRVAADRHILAVSAP